jgi:hypothetical protein
MFPFQEISQPSAGLHPQKKKQKLHCTDQTIQHLRDTTPPFGSGIKILVKSVKKRKNETI